MGYVKIDSRIFDSSLWMGKEMRDIFMVALILAMPFELTEPTEAIEVNSLDKTGFVVPPGWYGLARIAPDNLVLKALGDGMNLPDMEDGMENLGILTDPDPKSRSQEFEGRRLARINDGFIVLNFIKYRDKDHTAKARMQRYREKQKAARRSGPDPNVGVWKGDK